MKEHIHIQVFQLLKERGLKIADDGYVILINFKAKATQESKVTRVDIDATIKLMQNGSLLNIIKDVGFGTWNNRNPEYGLKSATLRAVNGMVKYGVGKTIEPLE